jgi:nascent polypeptide-associated complex subunit alpha
MIPGMDPRAMQAAMKKLGMRQTEIDAIEVVIRCADKEIVISDPSVQKISMMGQESYQISGKEQVRPRNTIPEITQDDIDTVVAQTNCTPDEASLALAESKGDLAAAILKLQK